MDFKIYQAQAVPDQNSILKEGDTVEICVINLYDLTQFLSDSLELKNIIKNTSISDGEQLKVVLLENEFFKKSESFILQILTELRELKDSTQNTSN